ncbi:MAG: glycosyltransferase family 4 protein [Candidatus Promineifilaceae bacterium]|nr:glycosyltransferase family 4 protein [Candidatus Promineifilaceae bacterium]
MRVALYHNLPAGGGRRAVFEMTRGLVERGHVVDEYCPATAETEFLSLAGIVGKRVILPFEPAGVAPRRIPMLTPYLTAGRLVADLWRLRRLNRTVARLIDTGGYDVAFVHDCQLVLNPDVLAFLSTPSLFYCHHGAHHLGLDERVPLRADSVSLGLKQLYYYLPRQLYPQIRGRREKRNILSATAVVTNSNFAARKLEGVYGSDIMETIYLGVNEGSFRPMSLPRHGYVLAVGNVSLRKRYDFLVEALARIEARRRPMLVIATNTTSGSLVERLKRLAVMNDVSLRLESVSNDERLAQLYNQAGVVAHAAADEPWGLAVVEAMACGTPVVAVAEGGPLESIQDQESGMLVERELNAFAIAIERLLVDRSLATRLGEAAAARVRERFLWSQTTARTEAALHRTIAGLPQ